MEEETVTCRICRQAVTFEELLSHTSKCQRKAQNKRYAELKAQQVFVPEDVAAFLMAPDTDNLPVSERPKTNPMDAVLEDG